MGCVATRDLPPVDWKNACAAGAELVFEEADEKGVAEIATHLVAGVNPTVTSLTLRKCCFQQVNKMMVRQPTASANKC
jgi:hypothetical protein